MQQPQANNSKHMLWRFTGLIVALALAPVAVRRCTTLPTSAHAWVVAPPAGERVLDLAALGLLLCAARFVLALLLFAAGLLPGLSGHRRSGCRRAAVRLVPALALAGGLAGGRAGPTAAADGPSGPFERLPAPAPAPVSGGARASPGAERVLVAPGDTLWSIAAHDLPPPVTPTRVAAAWPRWWQANRAVIGADPHLIRPGQRLRPPGP